MHDRRINGEAQLFGNQGALFMNAMTWWDHKTQSVWSQPWGLAIDGELFSTRLKPVPATLATWGGWKTEHPNTLALETEGPAFATGGYRFLEDFVVGVVLGEQAKAYQFRLLRDMVVVNDTIGSFPIVLHTNPETKTTYVYLRKADGQTLTFEKAEGDRMRDKETGSLWDPVRGLAISGPLEGEGLQQVPSNSSFEVNWFDFYPNSLRY